jgi:hypothetical protein
VVVDEQRLRRRMRQLKRELDNPVKRTLTAVDRQHVLFLAEMVGSLEKMVASWTSDSDKPTYEATKALHWSGKALDKMMHNVSAKSLKLLQQDMANIVRRKKYD